MIRIAHSFEERGHDSYETPPVAVAALLEAENLPDRIWECACGPGSVARTLRDAGHQVIATDLIDYDSPDQDQGGVDFLKQAHLPPGVRSVVSNPPYRLAKQFVTHAISLRAEKVCLLLRLSFLESERRTAILEGGQLARVRPFRNRLPMMHRRNWQGPRAASATPYAWFVWALDHSGPPEIHRISWRRS